MLKFWIIFCLADFVLMENNHKELILNSARRILPLLALNPKHGFQPPYLRPNYVNSGYDRRDLINPAYDHLNSIYPHDRSKHIHSGYLNPKHLHHILNHKHHGFINSESYDNSGMVRPNYIHPTYDRIGYDRPTHNRFGYDRPNYDYHELDHSNYDRPGYIYPEHDHLEHEYLDNDHSDYDHNKFNHHNENFDSEHLEDHNHLNFNGLTNNEYSDFKILSDNKLLLKENSKPLNCDCVLGFDQRVVGGHKSKSNSIPWQASLAKNGHHYCGGILINSLWIMTAAHCVNENISNLTIRLGINDLNEPITDENIFLADKIIINPDYLTSKRDISDPGDIALIKLSRPVDLESGLAVKAACLGLNKKYSSLLMASGWGRTNSRETNTNNFELKPPLIPNHLMEIDLKEIQSSKDHLILAKGLKKNSSICNGDSGGPLHSLEIGLRGIVQGISSYVSGNQTNNKLTFCEENSIFARISFYKTFIDQTLGEDNYCQA